MNVHYVNENGLSYEKTEWSKPGESAHTFFEYNEDGELCRIKTYEWDLEYKPRSTKSAFIGHPMEIVSRKKGKLLYDIEITYEYDHKGNWIVRTQSSQTSADSMFYEEGIWGSRQTRTIEYYE